MTTAFVHRGPHPNGGNLSLPPNQMAAMALRNRMRAGGLAGQQSFFSFHMEAEGHTGESGTRLTPMELTSAINLLLKRPPSELGPSGEARNALVNLAGNLLNFNSFSSAGLRSRGDLDVDALMKAIIHRREHDMDTEVLKCLIRLAGTTGRTCFVEPLSEVCESLIRRLEVLGYVVESPVPGLIRVTDGGVQAHSDQHEALVNLLKVTHETIGTIAVGAVSKGGMVLD